MNPVNHFQNLAKYNQRMNQQVYSACHQLSPQELTTDMGAFFGSIFGTLNHIMVGDLIWLNRFNTIHDDGFSELKVLSSFTRPKKLNEAIYSEFDALHQARQKLDKAIITWTQHELSELLLRKALTYQNTKGEPFQRNLGELISHFFNHQTHHRGQVSTLLNQRKIDIGITDYLMDIPIER